MDYQGRIVAEFSDPKEALACIVAISRILNRTIRMPASGFMRADIPKGANMESVWETGSEQAIIARR